METRTANARSVPLSPGAGRAALGPGDPDTPRPGARGAGVGQDTQQRPDEGRGAARSHDWRPSDLRAHVGAAHGARGYGASRGGFDRKFLAGRIGLGFAPTSLPR